MAKKLLLGIPLALLLGLSAFYFYVQYRAKSTIDQVLASLEASGQFQETSYEDVKLALNGDVHISRLQLANPEINIELEKIAISNFDYQNSEPHHLQLHVENLRFPDGIASIAAFNNPYFPKLFGALLKDNTLPLTVDYGYDYDPRQDDQVMTNAALNIPNLFALSTESETRHIPLQTLFGNQQTDPAAAADLLSAAAFPSASFRLQDFGLVNTVLDAYAELSGARPSDLRAQVQSQLQGMHLMLPQDQQQFAISASAALSQFLEGGRTLEIGLAPEYGGKVEQLQPEVMGAFYTGDFSKAIELLHLKIETR
jgi:hypothetical protein